MNFKEKEEERLLKKIKILLEKNLSLKEIEESLGIPSLEEKPEEIMKLAYQFLQDDEYIKMYHYIFGNEQMNSLSNEFMNKISLLLDHDINVYNIEDYANKYYVENIYNQMRR